MLSSYGKCNYFHAILISYKTGNKLSSRDTHELNELYIVFSCAKHIYTVSSRILVRYKELYIFILTKSWAPDTDKNHRSIF